MDALFLGAILSISSTTIIVKALEELRPQAGAVRPADLRHPDRRRHPRHRHASRCSPASRSPAPWCARAGRDDAGRAGALPGGGPGRRHARRAAAAGLRRQVPQQRDAAGHACSGCASAFCLLVVKLDYSVALGAFLIGAIIAEARQLDDDRAAHRAGPRHVQRHLLRRRIGLLIDPARARRLRAADRRDHRGRRRRQGPGLLASAPSWPATTRARRCASAWGWRRSASSRSSSRSLGLTLKVTSDFLYPDRGRRLGDHDAADALPDPARRSRWRIGSAATLPAWVARPLSLYTAWLESLQPAANRLRCARSWGRSCCRSL